MATQPKPPIISAWTIGLLCLLPIAPLQAQPASTITPQERLALLEKISGRHTVMCGDEVFGILEGGNRWIDAAKTPADREAREKLLASVFHHSELIAAIMMVTDPEIRQVILIPLGDRHQSIITHADKCGIKLTLQDIANAPSADAYLNDLQKKSREEIHRLITQANAPRQAFDRLSAMFISSVIGRWSWTELRALRD